ncbi:hypothetical protein GPECTOR_13g774 [Gonium pectorale]|uniref:Peptidase M11 gametolysin domain-containing protein n=1 Tax=Gonium pectorale TaxID=33097 RepID=A0A150GN97_GONPE|nr:hypothetical protein GPECTOR_13g774 [Gonium pectorale]|eukprot:KXZ51287.1 hypothetical protein GPECTOR_13g774 [Gonium pectorale]
MEDPNCAVPRETLFYNDAADQFRAQGVPLFRAFPRGGVTVFVWTEAQFVNGDLFTLELQPASEAAQRRALQEGAPTAPKLSVRNYTKKPSNASREQEIYTPGNPIDLQSVVYIIDLSDMLNFLYGNGTTSRVNNNLNNYFLQCSYNKTFFKPENVAIVRVPIRSCSGVLYNNSLVSGSVGSRVNASLGIVDWWSYSDYCDASEQAAWIREAEAEGRAQSATNPGLERILRYTKPRRRNIYVLPNNAKCPWDGFGDVTCTTPTCTTFVLGKSLRINDTAAAALVHEQMHNYGLEHAGIEGDPYGDTTDVMGDARLAKGALMCSNAPNMYRVGWATPTANGNITSSNFTGTKNVLDGLAIPAASLTDANMVILNLAVTNTSASRLESIDTYYLSYRVRASAADKYDGGLPSSVSRRLFIHKYNGIQDERVFGFRPVLMQTLNTVTNPRYWPPSDVTYPYDLATGRGGFFRVDLRATNATHAVVSICRATGKTETACNDGLDNDCDGAIDKADADCPV